MLVAELDRRVGRRRRSAFIARTVERALDEQRRWDEIVASLGGIADEVTRGTRTPERGCATSVAATPNASDSRASCRSCSSTRRFSSTPCVVEAPQSDSGGSRRRRGPPFVCAVNVEELWRGARTGEESAVRRLLGGLQLAPLGEPKVSEPEPGGATSPRRPDPQPGRLPGRRRRRRRRRASGNRESARLPDDGARRRALARRRVTRLSPRPRSPRSRSPARGARARSPRRSCRPDTAA